MSRSQFSKTNSDTSNLGALSLQNDTGRSERSWWWHRLTMPMQLGPSSNFRQRENRRHAYLVSTSTFFLVLVVLLLIPATFFIPNHLVIFFCLFMLGICAITLLLNRANKVLAAAILVVSMLELALVVIIASTMPFDVGNLPLYDLLVMTVLFAGSLLPFSSIFVTALFNMILIVGFLYLQRYAIGFATPDLQRYLQSQFYAALVRPAALEILAGVIISLWVSSTSRAIARADRAEMVALLEHEIAEQKEELQAGIQLILEAHTQIANGNLLARAPLTKDNALWPLSQALNMLLTRFQRASQAEQQLEQTRRLLSQLVQTLQHAEHEHKSLPNFSRTSTPLDALLAQLSGKKLSSSSSPQREYQ
jgi:hypothetical protein